jgi:hypothetical protein
MNPLEERLYALAERLRSSYDPQYADTLVDLVSVGEPVVGLEILSDQLLDDEVGIEPAVFREIEELSHLMGMKPRYWEQLQSRVREARPGGMPDPSDAGWPSEQRNPDTVKLPAPLMEILDILQRAYPDGLPRADYFPFLVVLQIDMNEENLSRVVAEFLDDETVVIANDAVKAASGSVPRPEEVARVRIRLEAAGWEPELDEDKD